MLSPKEIQQKLDRLLFTVQKPGRYTGGEYNQIVKDWDTIQTKVALIFPDLYDLGMSNLGLAILYDLLNRRPDTLAERAFCPWDDMEAVMREHHIPLYSLETKHPLKDFDILGFSLPYETLYTNVLNSLDLAGIPLFASQRADTDPLIIAGGHSTFNPEPMWPFIDAFVIGEGEEVMVEIVETHQQWKASGAPRADLWRALAKLWGVYVPQLYEAHYHEDGTFARLEKLNEEAQLPIAKRQGIPVGPGRGSGAGC
ncbi:MAG TPA: B12-binding domain-containing radical SAM protein, partial [Anaerolineales bacterium]|nr:B12-binding domain-containing radical SAM protein [Anaerolineales bacterium]